MDAAKKRGKGNPIPEECRDLRVRPVTVSLPDYMIDELRRRAEFPESVSSLVRAAVAQTYGIQRRPAA
jgi:hypothetical protein